VLRAAAALLSITLHGIPIIGYHEVDPNPTSGWSVRSDEFVEQMELLDAAGYHVIPIADLADYLGGTRKTLPPNPIVVTVDDGWLCAYTEIAPVMRRFAYPWSLYVYPAIIGHGEHALTWPEVLALQAEGVDIEDHTMTHAHLMRRSHADMSESEYLAWLDDELAASKRAIEAETGKDVRFVAYPYGDHDTTVEREAECDNYLLGLTSESGLNTRSTDPMRLHRLAVESDTTLDRFAKEIGLAPLTIEHASPANGVLTSPAFTATVDAGNVRAVVLGRSDVRSAFDPATHRLTVTFDNPPRSREELLIVDDADRRAAVVTLYASDADRERDASAHKELSALPLHHAQK